MHPSARPWVEAASDERGYALPTVLMVIVIGFLFSTAAVIASVASQDSSSRDQDSKVAFATADAGVQQALFRQNKVSTTAAAPCVVNQSGTFTAGAASADGWCPALTASVGGAAFSYRVKPPTDVVVNGQTRRQTSIVSTGTVDGVSRRVSMVASSVSGSGIFGNERAVGIDYLNVGTGNGKGIFTDSGSNGDVTATNATTICGNIRYGVGHQFVGADHQCAGYQVNSGNSSYPVVDISPYLTNNSNARLSNGQDTITGSVSWNPTTKTLDMQGNSSVTLGGTLPYVFCTLTMNGNSDLIMPTGANAKIYFNSPEACGLSSPAQQIDITGNSSIVATGWDPAHGLFELPGIFMVGSSSSSCSVNMTGSAKANEFVIYAPRCSVTVDGSSDYWGAILGKSLDVSGSAKVFSDINMPNPQVSVVMVYQRDRYVECGPAGTTPDANC
jgi:Tfp pilus assembly protein PilX